MEVQLDDSRVAALRELNIPFALIGRTCDVTGLHYVDIVPALPTDRLSTSSLRCRQTVRSGRDAAMELVARAPDTTAVLIVDEAAAAGLVSELAQMGRAVPGDIFMMSSRDMAAICNPPLTTVTAPGTELGRLGVEALLRQLDGGTPMTPVLRAGVLALGESTNTVRGHSIPDTAASFTKGVS